MSEPTLFPSTQWQLSQHAEKVKYGEVGRATSATMSFTATKLGKLSLFKTLPHRGHGTVEDKVALWANQFQLNINQNTVLHRYHLTITCEGIEDLKSSKKIIEVLLADPRLSAPGNTIVTDWKSVLYSLHPIQPLDQPSSISSLRDENLHDSAPPAKYKIEWNEGDSVVLQPLNEDLMSATICYSKEECAIVQALKILLRHKTHGTHPGRTNGETVTYLHDNATHRRRFGQSEAAEATDNKAHYQRLPGGVTAIRGHSVDARLGSGRLLLDVNVSHGLFYSAVRLDKFMQSIYNFDGATRPSERQLRELERTLHGVRVKVILEGSTLRGKKMNTRRYTIHGLASPEDGTGANGERLPEAPTVPEFGAGSDVVKFLIKPDKENSVDTEVASVETEVDSTLGSSTPSPLVSPGGRKTVLQHIKDRYPGTRVNKRFPVVNFGSQENPIYYPPECCEVMPGQSYTGKLSESQSKAVTELTLRTREAGSLLGNFSVCCDLPMNKVEDRELKAPPVTYAISKSARAPNTKDPDFGIWKLKGMRLFRATTLPRCTPVEVRIGEKSAKNKTKDIPDEDVPDEEWKAVQQHLTAFLKEAVAHGIQIAQKVEGTRPEFLTISDAGDKNLADYLGQFATKDGFLLVLLEKNKAVNAWLYDQIKYHAEVKLGIRTVCMSNSKARALDVERDGLASYFESLVLKTNLKFGGINHVLPKNALGIIDDRDTMVVGINVANPPMGSRPDTPCVVAMVASVDSVLAQWPVELRIQKATRNGKASEIGKTLNTRLCLWKSTQSNTHLPRNILVYRNGVSESQHQSVLSEELREMREACSETYTREEMPMPNFTIIVVSKRQASKGILGGGCTLEKNKNLQIATITDHGVTGAGKWDFHLKAHNVPNGKARPVHYVIYHNEIFNHKDHVHPPNESIANVMEQLTHNMCYLFGRATKSVSTCPPAYYAHLACTRAKCYLAAKTPGQYHPIGTQSDDPWKYKDWIATMQEPRAEQINAIKVKGNLRDTMFYI